MIEQTLREKLPDNFQTSEYLLAHGFVDQIVPRPQLKKTLAQLVRFHRLPQKPAHYVASRSDAKPLSSAVSDRNSISTDA